MPSPASDDSPILRLWFGLTTMSALTAAVWLVRIPAGPKHAVLLGLSASRLAALAALLAAALLFFILATRPVAWLEAHRGALARRAWFFPAWLTGTGAATLAGYAATSAPALSRPLLERLLPLTAFLAAAGYLAACFIWALPARADRDRPAGDSRRTPPASLLIFALIFTAAWLPRSLDLDRFVTVDEPTWIERTERFIIALAQGDFAGTYQTEHPGVPLMWAGTLSFRLYLGRDAGILHQADLTDQRLEDHILRRGFSEIDLLALARLFLSFLSSAAVALAAVYAGRVLNPPAALLGGLLLAFDPFHIAHTRLLTMDGLLAGLFALSLLAFMSYQSSARRRDLLISGIAAGLSWLTKTPGLFLAPAIGVAGLAYALWRPRPASAGERLRAFILPLLIWGLIGMATFVILFPAMWAAPVETVRLMLSKTLSYAAEGHRGPVFFAGQIYPDGRITGLRFALVSILWRTTPVVLLGLAAAAWGVSRKRVAALAPGMLLSAALLFVLLQSMGAKKFDRYFLAAFPLLDFTAGAGLAAAVAWLQKKSRGLAAGGAVVMLAAALLPALSTYPYFLSYYNPLLGGSARAPQTMMIGWGEGLDEAGRYLSRLPGAEDLRVIAWYNRGSFAYFFTGESAHLPTNQEPSPERMAEILGMDYAVIYLHQWQRRTPDNLLSILEKQEPVHTVVIDGLEYVRIYRLGEER